MPRKKTVQPSAEKSTDPMSLFNLALREFKKDPSTWAEDGLYETVTPLIDITAGDLDTGKLLDQAVRTFKLTRSQAAAALLMETARLYKSVKLAEIAKKYGVVFAPQEESDDEHDQGPE